MIARIRRWLATRHARALNAMKQQRRVDQRERFKATARQMRDELGLPALPVLHTKGK